MPICDSPTNKCAKSNHVVICVQTFTHSTLNANYIRHYTCGRSEWPTPRVPNKIVARKRADSRAARIAHASAQIHIRVATHAKQTRPDFHFHLHFANCIPTALDVAYIASRRLGHEGIRRHIQPTATSAPQYSCQTLRARVAHACQLCYANAINKHPSYIHEYLVRHTICICVYISE